MGATSKGRWSYACSKAIDEFLALAYWREKKLPTIVVRLFNTVGPRQTGQYGMVIPTFVKQALSGRPITVFGDGKQSRCFGYVGDVVGALMKLMDDEKAVGEVFNIGSNQEISIMDLARKVKELANSESEIVLVPYDEAYEEGFEDMPRRIPDISKVNAQVGFKPEIQHAEKLFAAGQFPIVSSCFKHVIKIMKEPNKRAASEIARFTQMSVHSLFVEQLLFPVHQGRPQVVNLFSEELLNFITFA